MPYVLQAVPVLTLERLKVLGQSAAASQCDLYLVGGVVRDLLLGRPLGDDVDVLVIGPLASWIKLLKTVPEVNVRFHSRFATATVTYEDGQRFDLAMCRREEYPCAGALPEVAPGTLAEDLFRRDFTINAMALSLSPGTWGELTDLYGGQRDLRSRRIRILHDLSFHDDATRILRAARFAQRLGFRMDKVTARLIRNALANGWDREVSSPRYFSELEKMLQEPRAVAMLKQVIRWGGERLLGKELSVPWIRLAKLREHQKEIQAHGFPYGLLMLMGLMERETLSRIQAQISAWQCHRSQAEALMFLSQQARIRGLLRKRCLQPSQIYRILHPLPETAHYYLRYAFRPSLQTRRVELYMDRLRLFRSRLESDDLVACGVARGIRFGKIKMALLWAGMDGSLPDRQSEVEFVRHCLAEG